MNWHRIDPSVRSAWLLRVKAETALSTVCAVLAVVAWFVPDWIERLFEVSPDHGSGETEWSIVLAFAIAALMVGWLAWRDWWRLLHAQDWGR